MQLMRVKVSRKRTIKVGDNYESAGMEAEALLDPEQPDDVQVKALLKLVQAGVRVQLATVLKDADAKAETVYLGLPPELRSTLQTYTIAITDDAEQEV